MRTQHRQLLVKRGAAQGSGEMRLGDRVPVGKGTGTGGALGHPARMLRHVAEPGGEVG